jgi:glycosyltransferase involved in cell wall biosynthesis
MHPSTQLVSITIPFLNRERFLPEAIESVLCQTYTNWDLHLVDDGSTDGSTRMARDYAARFSRKVYYHEHPGHANRGQSASRNLGIRNSTGEFIAFLDSDDVWLPHKIAEQVAILATHPDVGLVYGHSVFWYSWNKADPTGVDEIHPLAPAGKLYRPPFLFKKCYPLGSFGMPPPCSWMLRASVIEKVGCFEESFNPQTHQYFEDAAFISKVYLNVPVFVAGYCGDKYRCNQPSSITNDVLNAGRQDVERRFYFQWLRRYLVRNGIWDPGVWWVVLRRSWTYWLPLNKGVADRMRTVRRFFRSLPAK